MSGEAESDFRGLVVHELRSPIAVIVGLAASLSARRGELTEEQIDEALRRIHAQGGQLAQLVDDLLDLAQVEAGRFGVLRGRVEAVRRPEGVLATVSDDGPRVRGELAELLFEKFSRETSDGHGAGLGLAIVRGLMEAFGGRAWYEQSQPTGARFLLLSDETEPGPDNPQAGSELQRWSESVSKILVVDDESNMRFLLRMVFEAEGFEVVEANHGAAALERVREAQPDLIVTDLMMPVMDGRDLIERLRADAETAGIPILVLSANRNLEVAGADLAMSKPFDPDGLLDAARSLRRKDAAS
jgi:CheY-like chemotaxis protein